VKYVREARRSLGDGRKAFDPAAAPARAKLGRSLAARGDVAPGTVLTEDMLCLRSPGTGIPWRDHASVIGRVARVAISANSLIALDDLDIPSPATMPPALRAVAGSI
jgi:sialic acid synthase SpsE